MDVPSSWFDVVGTGHSRRPEVKKDENDKSANPKNARVFRTKLCILCCTRLRIDKKVDFPRHLQTHCGIIDDSLHVPCPHCYGFVKRDKIKAHIENQHPGSSSTVYDNKKITIKSYTNETDHMDLTVPSTNKRAPRKTIAQEPKTLAEALNFISDGGWICPHKGEEDATSSKSVHKSRKRKADPPKEESPSMTKSRRS